MIIALLPPLWYYVVNPRVDALHEFQNGKKKEDTDAFDNVSP